MIRPTLMVVDTRDWPRALLSICNSQSPCSGRVIPLVGFTNNAR